ncbi:MAG: glutamate--tRNA ligase family protein [Flavobacteriales bacterium]
MTERTRIAPTPSGYLHAGNAIGFLITARLAQERKATLRLRIDDLDAERSRPAYIADIFDSLEWLGIRRDEGPTGPEDQAARWSQELRIPRYQELLSELAAAGHLYGCTCSRQEIIACSCREERITLDAPAVSWRLRVPDTCSLEVVGFNDRTRVDLAGLLHDPVLRQRTGRPAYQIASLADDVDHGITFIVRGVDLLPSTACQLYLAQLLGLGTFAHVRFLHHPLITDAKGNKLSKSEGASSLRAMRQAGIAPGALRRQAQTMLEGSLK